MKMNAKHPRYIAAVEISSYSSDDNDTTSCGSNSSSSSSSASSYRFSAYSSSYVIDASRGSNNDSASSSSSSSDGSRPTVMAEKDHQGRLNQSEFAESCLTQFTQERRKHRMESSNTPLMHNKKKQKRRQQRMDTRKDILMANHSNQKKQPRPQHDDVDRTIHNVGAWGERVQTTVLELKDTDGQSRRPTRKRMIDRSRLNRTEVTGIDERDHNGNGRINRRCDLYLGLAATYLVLISSIVSSNNYSTTSSSVEAAVLTLSSLSFIQTFILGMRCICRPFREYFTSKYLPSCRYNGSLLHKLRVGLTFEQLAASVVLLNTCISSGLILYPRIGVSAGVAVTGSEVWNANLFYSGYISLYGSAYLGVNVFVRDGTTASSSSNQSSIKMLLFMALFSSICTATSLLIMRYGPACSGDYLGKTPYCSSAETAGWLSVWCAMFSSIPCVTTACCHESYHFPCTSNNVWMRNRRNSWGRRVSQRHRTLLQHLILLGTSTLVLILQSVNVAIVSSPSGGPGHDVGNAFVTSWVAWMISLLLWKNSCVGFVYMISTPSLPLAMNTTSPEGKREKYLSRSDDSARSGMSTTMTEDYTYGHEYSDTENAGEQEDHIVNKCVGTPLSQHKSGDALEKGHGQFRPDPEERVVHDNSVSGQRVHVDVEGHNLYHSTVCCVRQAQHKASDHSEYQRAAQDIKKGNSQGTNKDRSSYDSGSTSDPHGVHHSWDLYHDAKRKNVLEVDFNSSTSTQATRECKRLSQFSSSQYSEQVDHEWDFSPILPPTPPPPPINQRENHQEPKIILVPTDTGIEPTRSKLQNRQSFQSSLDTLHETSLEGFSSSTPVKTGGSSTSMKSVTNTSSSSESCSVDNLQESSLEGSSRNKTGTTRSGSTYTNAGSNKSSSYESSSHRINKNDRNEKPHDRSGENSPSGGVSSKNREGTQSRRTPPPPPPPRRNPKLSNKTSRGGGAGDHLPSNGISEKEPRINGNRMPAKGLWSTSTAKGSSSFTKEASPLASGEKKLSDGSSATPATMRSFTNEASPPALGEKNLSDGSSASPVTDGSSATPVTDGSSATPVTMASKRNAATAAAVAAASHRPLTLKKIASLTESDLSESDFDILLNANNSVVTEITLDEFVTPPFNGQDIKTIKLLVDMASASHAAAVSSNAKRTVNSTMEDVFNRFRYKPVRKDSTPRQEQSQTSSPHHLGSQGLPSCQSLRNESNQHLPNIAYPLAASGSNSQANPVKEANHRTTEAFLASSMKEALMSLHGSEGCASHTTDENLAYDRSRRRGTINSRSADRPAVPSSKSHAYQVRAFLASSVREALMSLHSREGCASPTTDENSVYDRSRRSGTIDSRVSRSRDAYAQRERRPSAPIKQRRRSQDSGRSIYSQDDVTCVSIPGERYDC